MPLGGRVWECTLRVTGINAKTPLFEVFGVLGGNGMTVLPLSSGGGQKIIRTPYGTGWLFPFHGSLLNT